jgi:hypothetical protein
MLIGGDDAIIIGRLPTGHAAVRGARFTTFPPLRLPQFSGCRNDVGLKLGFGTLSNHSLQLPEPGSCTIQRPDISGAAAPVYLRMSERHADRKLAITPATIALTVIRSSATGSA